MSEVIENLTVLTRAVAATPASELIEAIQLQLQKITSMTVHGVHAAYATLEVARAAGNISEEVFQAVRKVFISRMGELTKQMPTQNGQCGHWQDVFCRQTGYPFGRGG